GSCGQIPAASIDQGKDIDGSRGSTDPAVSSPRKPRICTAGAADTVTLDPAGTATPGKHSEISRAISVLAALVKEVAAMIEPVSERSSMATDAAAAFGFCKASAKNVLAAGAGVAKIAPESGCTGKTGSVAARSGRELFPSSAARRYE